MKYKEGVNRNQAVLISTCLEDTIAADNEVRLYDAFAEAVDMKSHGFAEPVKDSIKGGTPPYRNEDMLKLYLYGYINRIRSSRQLSKHAK